MKADEQLREDALNLIAEVEGFRAEPLKTMMMTHEGTADLMCRFLQREIAWKDRHISCAWCGDVTVANTKEEAQDAVAKHIMACPKSPTGRLLALSMALEGLIYNVTEATHEEFVEALKVSTLFGPEEISVLSQSTLTKEYLRRSVPEIYKLVGIPYPQSVSQPPANTNEPGPAESPVPPPNREVESA